MRSELQGFALQDFIFLQLVKNSKNSKEKYERNGIVLFMCNFFYPDKSSSFFKDIIYLDLPFFTFVLIHIKSFFALYAWLAGRILIYQ